jgi:hypothetical protein
MEIPPALLLGSRAAAEYAMAVGMDWIEARTSHLAALTRSLLAELPGVQVLDRGAELSGIVTAHAEHWVAQAVLKKLYASNINCRVSPLWVAQHRFSPKRRGVGVADFAALLQHRGGSASSVWECWPELNSLKNRPHLRTRIPTTFDLSPTERRHYILAMKHLLFSFFALGVFRLPIAR